MEKLVAAYYTPETPDEGAVEAGAKKVVLPEDVELLDKCADAAQRLLSDAPYTSDEARPPAHSVALFAHHLYSLQLIS